MSPILMCASIFTLSHFLWNFFIFSCSQTPTSEDRVSSFYSFSTQIYCSLSFYEFTDKKVENKKLFMENNVSTCLWVVGWSDYKMNLLCFELNFKSSKYLSYAIWEQKCNGYFIKYTNILYELKFKWPQK
jgi:hypothetical protein